MNRPRKITPQTIALTGLLAAVGLVILFLAGVTPSGWVGVTAIAGIAVAVAIASAGYLSGALCYLVSGLLGLLLVPAKHAAVLFLCLFGLYPLLKNLFERLKVRPLEYVLKLAFFNAVFFALYFLAFQLFFQPAAEGWRFPVPVLPALAVVCNVLFLIYDYAFSKVMALLQVRLISQLQRRFAGR